MGGLYGALCSLRASQGQRADAGVHCLLWGSLRPVGCSGWGAEDGIKAQSAWLIQWWQRGQDTRPGEWFYCLLLLVALLVWRGLACCSGVMAVCSEDWVGRSPGTAGKQSAANNLG